METVTSKIKTLTDIKDATTPDYLQATTLSDLTLRRDEINTLASEITTTWEATSFHDQDFDFKRIF